MDVKEIVNEYLKKHGYDGLVNEDYECGCVISNLMSWCEPNPLCEPGYMIPCDCGDHAFHITTEKPEG